MRCGRSRSSLFFLLLFALLLPARADEGGAFFLHDGDTVVFYGDSITEQGRYTRDVETYVLTRFPNWRVKFVNSGWIGDKVSGGDGGSLDTRLKRDVLPYQPTVVTILLGMNDAGYTHFHQPAYDAYVLGLTQIVDTLQTRLPGVRVTLLTPPFYDEYAPGSRHLHGYNDVLLRYGEAVKKLGADRNIPVVDLNAPMAAATGKGRAKDPKFTLVPDGIHPSEAGHLVMAAAILTAWHAPTPATDLTGTPDAPVTAAAPLPWPLPDAAQPAFAVSPLPDPLNHFRFYASGLNGSRYDLLVDGTPAGTRTGREWERGADLTQLPALPQNTQAKQILEMVQKRLDIWHTLWKGGPDAIAQRGDAPAEAEIAALTAIDRWLDGLRDQARAAAPPQSHSFALRLSKPLPPGGKSLTQHTFTPRRHNNHETSTLRHYRMRRHFGNAR